MALAEIDIPSNIVHYELEINGNKNFKVVRFVTRDAMNELGYAEVDLINTDMSAGVGKQVGLTAKLRFRCGTEDNPRWRHYCGVIQRFELTGVDHKAAHFHARIVPRFWKLTQTRRSRVLVTERKQNKKIKDILEKVLKEGGLSGSDINIKLDKSYEPYTFLTQYRESDFQFLARLMEEEGIFWFIDHSSKGDVLTIFDSNNSCLNADPFNEVLFRTPTDAMTDKHETIHNIVAAMSLNHTESEIRDYDFKDSHKKIIGQHQEKFETGNQSKLEFYDYPGHFQDQEDATARMKTLALSRQHSFIAGSVRLGGESEYRSLAVGRFFKAKGHPVTGLNRTYLCTAVMHEGTELAHLAGDQSPLGMGGVTYSNRFECFPDDIPFVPPLTIPQPIVAGTQTAVVVGPPGEEIHTDEFGRIKVQMHWDREHNREEDSSFWVRVNQGWAGRKWGMFFLPRVGQEVIVDFLEGNPNNPLVIGSVYNDYQRVPYVLPEHKTRSTIKTNSTKGGVGFNEIRFEDKKDKEQIFIHAEKDFDLRVKNVAKERVGGDKHVVVGWEKDGKKGGDWKEKVFQDRTSIVKRNQLEHIEGNLEMIVGYGEAEGEPGQVFIENEGNWNQYVDKDLWLLVHGDQLTQVDGYLSMKIAGDLVTGSDKLKHQVKSEVHVKCDQSIVIDAGTELTLKVGGNFIKIDMSGVTIMGTMVKINSGGAPGTGSPITPTDVERQRPNKAPEPAIADDDKTGDKSTW